MSNARDNWSTPSNLFDKLNAEFSFTVDLAAEEWSAKCTVYSDEKEDSLSVPWHKLDGWLFLNPPFSELATWTRKAAEECLLGARIVMVLPAHRCEQAWFHQFVLGVATEIRMVRKRVAYDPPPGIKKSSPMFASMVAIFDGYVPTDKTIMTGLDLD